MAKKAKEQEQEQAGASPTETPAEGEQNRQPLKRFVYAVGRDACVSASVWDRVVQLDGGESFTAYDVSVQRRVKVNGEWKTMSSFRAHELAVLQHAVGQAFAFILETKANKDSVPF